MIATVRVGIPPTVLVDVGMVILVKTRLVHEFGHALHGCEEQRDGYHFED